ncbi:lysylphosphatidylglycerol synthase transmembrane domain-containing protein [Spongiimicrobium salis]|uniref:lysylphosphatidylglycerol synthase transmembrane domain-containing protein n=1 Tax=Spongiimicrobium salis TaxID=1667022 RepID=UPI00374D4C90
MAKYRKKGITLLKLLFSAVLLYFIFTKIQLKDIASTLEESELSFLLLALVFFVLSKAIAAARLNLYFHQLAICLTQKSNLKLYLLGMFYNLFLPGGIGGDAYKGYVIKKKFQVATKKVVAVLILDRLSGLLLLFIYACMLIFGLEPHLFEHIEWLSGMAIVLGIIVFWFLNKRFFGYVLPIFWKSFGYSALVQLAQLVSVFCILKALHIELYTLAYLFIFLISSIVAVLPLTFGGIGSRELTFFYGAAWLDLEENTAISISLVFFLITALVSLFGIVYHMKKPALQTISKIQSLNNP